MAGAVSAGAYTAGVLDFLTEAIEEWYKAKAAPNLSVPMHEVSIDAFSGASAGGMCAAIASVMVQGTFQHIHNPQDPSVVGTTNKFYESWVNKIDIEWLLQTNDLKSGGPVVSLLDSSIIDEIADYAIAPGAAAPRRPYISPSLTLFLTLTNVRGVPFSLNGDAPGSVEEDIRYYGDRLQFETVASPADTPAFPLAKALPLGSSGGAWDLLKSAAMATGAFPLFLAPRRINRDTDDYLNSPWEQLADPLPERVPPHWTLNNGAVFPTLNVDGGVTDNDPFQLAHDYLAIHNPDSFFDEKTAQLKNPPDADKANCAVLTVAPFPAKFPYSDDYDFAANSNVFGMLPNLFTTLVAQSRFLGESLCAVASGTSFSRFVLAPSDADRPNDDALQCGLLGAFGGFFERGFRAHDYQLGRRNCQKFLLDHFRLSKDNPIIKAGLAKVDNPDAVVGAFSSAALPGTLPIIPLCGSAVPTVSDPVRATITSDRVDKIIDWAVGRMHAVAKPLLDSIVKGGLDHLAVPAVEVLISTVGRAKLREVLQEELKDVISG
jgi:hypothetical protein